MLDAKLFKDFIGHVRQKREIQEEQQEIIQKTIMEERVELFFDSIMSRIIFVAGLENESIAKLPFKGSLDDYISIIKTNCQLAKISLQQEEVLCSVLEQAEIMKYMFSEENITRVESLLEKHGYQYYYDQGLFRAWFCIKIPS